MEPCIETICIKDGTPQNLPYHQERIDRTLVDHACSPFFSLEEHINYIDTHPYVKCRVVYSTHIHKIEYLPYTIPYIKSLAIVEHGDVEYRYKYIDRDLLKKLYMYKGLQDDILIVKNGWITDSYFANTVFVSEGRYYTPDTPLLEGTRRARLIQEGKIKVVPIHISEINKYEYVTLINAMLSLDTVKVPIYSIY